MGKERIQDEGVIEINVMELISVLLKKAWIIIAAAILAGVLAFGYTYYCITPLYEASAMLYVNNSDLSLGSSSISITSSDLTASQRLVSTYSVILKSRLTLNEVIEKAQLPYTYNQLKGMISTSAVDETEVFSINVISSDPEEAEKIANTLADIIPEKIAAIVEGSSVRIVDYAVVPTSSISPSYSRNALIGAIVGVVLSAGFIILMYLLDDTITSEDYLKETYTDYPLLAVVPNLSGGNGGYYYAYGQKEETAEKIAKDLEGGEENG